MVAPSSELVDRLVADLKPASLLTPAPLIALSLMGSGLGLALIIAAYGVRPEISYLVENGVWPGIAPLLKPLMWGWLGITALRTMIELSRPEGHLRMGDLIPVAAILISQVLGLALDIASQGWTAPFDHAFGRAGLCIVTIAAGGLIGITTLRRVWLNHTASSHPYLLQGMAALACASLCAGLYALHCPMDAPAYALCIYLPVVIAVTVYGPMTARAYNAL